MRILHICSTIGVIAIICCASSHATVLYDGLLGTGMTDQNWLYLTDPMPGASAEPSVDDGATTLDTTPVTTDKAGYFSMTPAAHPGVGTLNSSVGFSVLFTVKLHSESHGTNTDRAGFSVIVIDSALKGVEVAFWTDEIWAYEIQVQPEPDEPLFLHSATEQAAFTTPTELTEYQLDFHGSTYSLSTGGNTLIEDGDLKDYTPHSNDVYKTPNLIFFGDDTSQADSEVSISRIELIPEPATTTVLLVGLAAGMAGRKRRAV